jgi:hypothetical protein
MSEIGHAWPMGAWSIFAEPIWLEPTRTHQLAQPVEEEVDARCEEELSGMTEGCLQKETQMTSHHGSCDGSCTQGEPEAVTTASGPRGEGSWCFFRLGLGEGGAAAGVSSRSGPGGHLGPDWAWAHGQRGASAVVMASPWEWRVTLERSANRAT